MANFCDHVNTVHCDLIKILFICNTWCLFLMMFLFQAKSYLPHTMGFSRIHFLKTTIIDYSQYKNIDLGNAAFEYVFFPPILVSSVDSSSLSLFLFSPVKIQHKKCHFAVTILSMVHINIQHTNAWQVYAHTLVCSHKYIQIKEERWR